MTAATIVGIFLLFFLIGLGIGVMASISGWRDVVWALTVTFGAVFIIVLAVALIFTGMWPWEPAFVEALQ